MSQTRYAIVLLLAAAAYAGGLPAQQQDFSQVQITSERLADNVHVLFGAGGNMGLLTGPDGAVLIDDQFAPLSEKILAKIATLTDKPVRFVLNTHFHFDHTGGNEALGETGSVIVAHDNTLKRLSTRQVIDLFNSERAETPAVPQAGLPIVTFAQSLSLHLNGEDIDAVHVPNAHTDTDIILHFRKANVVHMGDVFPGPSFPFIDSGNGGSLAGIVAATGEVLERTRADTKFIPGHAPVADRAQLEAYRQMLMTVHQRISDAIAAGKTQQQVIESRPTREFDEQYGKGFIPPDAFVQRVYVELRRTTY